MGPSNPIRKYIDFESTTFLGDSRWSSLQHFCGRFKRIRLYALIRKSVLGIASFPSWKIRATGPAPFPAFCAVQCEQLGGAETDRRMFALIAIIMAQLSDYRPSGIFTTAQPKILFTVLIGPFRFSKGVGIPTPKEKKKARRIGKFKKG